MKTRKSILIIGILIFSSFVVTAREKKAKVDTAAFNRIVELVKSKIFYITLARCVPERKQQYRNRFQIREKNNRRRRSCFFSNESRRDLFNGHDRYRKASVLWQSLLCPIR